MPPKRSSSSSSSKNKKTSQQVRLVVDPAVSNATLRLYTAMEQRQRRHEMEKFLHPCSDDDYLLSSTIKAAADMESSSSSKFSSQHFGPAAVKSTFANLKKQSPLYYIIEAVNEAEKEALKDPDNFPFYTLVLSPTPVGVPRKDEEESNEKKEETPSSSKEKRTEVANPSPAKSTSVTSPTSSSTTFTSPSQHHAKLQKLIAADPSAITSDLLPIVCEYVNARLSKYKLQSIALPTLKFFRPVSGIVTEILMNNWICGGGGGGNQIKLKNLFMNTITTTSSKTSEVPPPSSSSFCADFLPRDYSTIIDALKHNRLCAVKLDRKKEVTSYHLMKASTEIEWCAVSSLTMKKKQKRMIMTKNDDDNGDDDSEQTEVLDSTMFEKRDPAFISEVELGGLFGRVVASESKRRYRLMQIELDEMVPLIVGMLIGAQELRDQGLDLIDEAVPQDVDYDEENYVFEEEEDDDDDDLYVEFEQP